MRRIKVKLRVCCSPLRGIHFAVPDSKSTMKLRSWYVETTGGMSLDLPICHIPIGVDRGLSPICEDYKNGDWSAR